MVLSLEDGMLRFYLELARAGMFVVGKSGPNATFHLFFLGWVGLGLWSSSVSCRNTW